MQKPTVFISHSSRDAPYLGLLKQKLEQKTGGALRLFLSSDGESIPFGSNWVHEIEAALGRATIMFVAVSPLSVGSAWLYFESGHAYARGVSVIPIGIKGVSVESLKPPMSLLQGFNIRSYQGLNNLIAVINSQYGTHFEESFSGGDFDDLARLVEHQHAPLGSALRFLDRVEFDLPKTFGGDSDLGSHEIATEYPAIIRETLREAGQGFGMADSEVFHASGMVVEVSRDPTTSKPAAVLKADPLVLGEAVSICSTLVKALYKPQPPSFWFRAYFHRGLRILTTSYKVSSRLAMLGVTISDRMGDFFEYGNLLFRVEEEQIPVGNQPAFPTPGWRPPAFMRVIFPAISGEEVRVAPIVELLEQAGVIDESSM